MPAKDDGTLTVKLDTSTLPKGVDAARRVERHPQAHRKP